MSLATLPEDVVEAAAAWYDRLHREGVSAETRCAFEAWLGRSADHGAAYESVGRAWARAQAAALEPQILALRHETALRLTRRASAAIQPWHAAAAAVVLMVLGGAVATLGGDSKTAPFDTRYMSGRRQAFRKEVRSPAVGD